MSSLHTVRIGDILDVITDYHSNGSYKVLRDNVKLLSEPGYAIMIRTLNFERDDFANELIYVDKEAYDFLSSSKVFPNDILMNKIANPGSIYIMPFLDTPVTCGMNLFLIRFTTKVNQKTYIGKKLDFHINSQIQRIKHLIYSFFLINF